MLKAILFGFGLLTFLALLWHVGPSRMATLLAELGPGALVIVLLPSVVMYLVDAYAWRVTLRRHADQVPFWRLLAVRTAGEVVNMTTPTAYVGGEPVKAVLLKRYGVPLVDGMASVITAKTTMTLAEVVFILTGLTFAVWMPEAALFTGESGRVTGAVLTVAGLAAVTFVLLVIQRRGLFAGLLAVLRRLRLRLAAVESRREYFENVDHAIREFYRRHRVAFIASSGLFYVGWLAEALEVYVILRYVGDTVPSVATAVSLTAFAVIIKGGAFFIPGSLGAQEGGNVLLLIAYGYSDVAGLAFAVLRRVRELVWIAIGLLCLAAFGGHAATAPGSDTQPR